MTTSKKRAAGLVTAGLIALSLIAGCSTGNTVDNEANEPNVSGDPVTIMTIGPVDTGATSHPAIKMTAEVYETWINAHGGIQGRPLEILFCDEHGVQADAASCGREAVDKNVVGVISSFSFFGDAYMPTLEEAGIPYLTNVGTSPSEFTASNSYLIGNQPLWTVALIKRAVEDGCQKMAEVIIDGAQAFQPMMDNALDSLGATLHKNVTLPAAAQDYSPQVAQATADGTDCLLMIVPETELTAWNVAFAQSGSTARLYGPQGNLNGVSTKGIPTSVTDGAIVAGSFPDIQTAAYDDFRQALENTGTDTEKTDFNSFSGLGGWAGYTIATDIMNGIEGEITAETFKAALDQADSIETGGMTPTLDFTSPWDENPPFARIFARSAVYSTMKDGKIVPLTTEFEDLGALALGD